MNAQPYHSNNSVMPVWVTIDEAVNIIKNRVVLKLRPVKSGAMPFTGISRYLSIFSLR